MRKKTQITQDIIFPTAEEMLEKTKTHWPILTNQEILKKIEHESEQGKCEAIFSSVMLSADSIEELEKKGYNVRKWISKEPFYTINW